MAEQEQNKTEEATPFKLRRARERGMVARSLDLGFFGGLAALAAFLIVAGEALAFKLAHLMRQSLAAGMSRATDPNQAPALVASVYWPALQSIMLIGGTIVLIVMALEILQLRGIIFTTQPLKPDFSRINPAKGLKRLFSVRILKESLKNILKLAVYAITAALVVRCTMADPGRAVTDAEGLTAEMYAGGMRLILLFGVLALFFAALDQMLVRREFAKQMRMSRRELLRETKEREGEPRLKQKRKQLHAEFVRQSEGIGKLSGSDLVIVNPKHVAVALGYAPENMAAPTVTARARNHFALVMKREAFRLGVPIFENPPLARRLYRECQVGAEVGAAHYRPVAELYLKLRAKPPKHPDKEDAQADIPQE